MQNSVLVGILSTLMAKDKVTAEELATKYEISTRTVIRYIDAINESGVPIVSHRGRNGGYGIIEKYKINASFFTREEYDRIFDALKTLPPDKITNAITDKLQGLHSALSGRLAESDKVIIDTGFSSAFKNKFNILQQAIKENLCAQISYVDKFGEQSQRTVDPLTFVFKDNVWYIFTYCHIREDFRFFKLNRIAHIALTDQKFTPRPYTFDDTIVDKFLQSNKKVAVSLSFDNDALVEIQEWLGEENVIKKGAGYVATAQLPYDDFLITKILTFGERVKVLAPSHLATDVVKHLQRLLRFYTTL